MLTLSQLPAEVDDELQQQKTDGQEEQQAKHPERQKAVDLSEEQGPFSPGAAQNLHAASERRAGRIKWQKKISERGEEFVTITQPEGAMKTEEESCLPAAV